LKAIKIGILLLAAFWFIRCQEEKYPIEPVDNITPPADWFLIGVLPNPAKNQTFDSAYAEVAPYTHLVPVWGKPTPFYLMAKDLNGEWGRTFVRNLIRGNGMAPLVHLSFIGAGMSLVSPGEIENPSLANPAWRNAYRDAAIEIIKTIRPRYISLGNEVNRWLERYGTDGENGFLNWVSLYQEIYDTLKKISPQTRVFCTFSREVVDEHRPADMNCITLFDPARLDLIGITSYPFAVQGVNSPENIPADYYSAIAALVPNKPLGFTELCWWSNPAYGGETAESLFVSRIPQLLSGLKVEFVLWPWLCDLDSTDYTGFKTSDGKAKPALSPWQNLYRRIQ